jgi:hypothetical protein
MRTQRAHAHKKAKRSGQAERSGKGGAGVSPDYGDPTRTFDEEGKAERSCQAERFGKGWPGVSPDYDNPTRTHAEEGQVERSGKNERSGEGWFGVSPSYGNPTRKAERPAVCKPKRRQLCFGFFSDQGKGSEVSGFRIWPWKFRNFQEVSGPFNESSSAHTSTKT